MKKLLLVILALSALCTGSLGARDSQFPEDGRESLPAHDRTARIGPVVHDCDLRATEFKHALDRALDRSRLDGSDLEDRLNEDARRLDRAVTRLRESWDREHNVDRARQQVAEAIEAGRRLDRALARHDLRRKIQREWGALRDELNLLARVFDQPQIRWDDGDRREPRPDRDRVARIAPVVRDCDQRATDFKHALDRALDRSRLNGSNLEDRLNEDARRLDRAVTRLREAWERDHDVDRARQQVAEAIEAGRRLNRALARHELRRHIQREWDALRDELNLLAEVFGQPQIRWDN